MLLKENIIEIENQIENSKIGLPEEVFEFISRVTPMVNVDLLIKDEDNKTLLAWRDDEFSGTGWHVPGGIIRYKETFESRIIKVSEKEIGTSVKFDTDPIAVNEVMVKHNTRGHFVSFLFNCFLTKEFEIKNIGLTDKNPGYLAWFDKCPDNLLEVQKMYRKFI